MEQRLSAIVKDAPPSQKQQTRTFWQSARRFCLSKPGIAVLTFLVVFVLLLACQPSYIFRKNADNSRSLRHVNYALVVGLSVGAAALVVLIPFLILHKSGA